MANWIIASDSTSLWDCPEPFWILSWDFPSLPTNPMNMSEPSIFHDPNPTATQPVVSPEKAAYTVSASRDIWSFILPTSALAAYSVAPATPSTSTHASATGSTSGLA